MNFSYTIREIVVMITPVMIALPLGICLSPCWFKTARLICRCHHSTQSPPGCNHVYVYVSRQVFSVFPTFFAGDNFLTIPPVEILEIL